MGSTNKTKIGLSQFIDTDKPTWLGDYNTDMETITQNIDDLQVATSSVAMGAITKLETTVTAISDSVTANTNDIAALKNDVATNKASIDTVTADLNTLDTREQAHYDALKGQYDTQNQTLDDLQKQQNHFELNMNKMESDVVVNTASIAKMQVKIADLETASSTATSDITEIKTDIDNLQAETDTLDTTVRQHDSAIKKNQTDIATNTTNIGLIDNRVTAVEGYGADITALQGDVSTLQTDMATAKSDITANDNAIKAQQAITANIESGVDVPFGFGTTADGKRGYEKSDGTIEPFVTNAEYTDLQDDVTANMGDIADLTKKTANIVDGASIPYSLGIADGGAYGYIKNGEQGVTPFVGQEEVDALVKVSPVVTSIENKIENISEGAALKANVVASNTSGEQFSLQGINTGDTNSYKIGYQGQVRKAVFGSNDSTFDDQTDVEIPFSFGVDENGNYGYKKAGADAVTPFLNLNLDNINMGNIALGSTQSAGVGLGYTLDDVTYFIPINPTYDAYIIKSSTDAQMSCTKLNVFENVPQVAIDISKIFKSDIYMVNVSETTIKYYLIAINNNNRRVPGFIVSKSNSQSKWRISTL